MTNEHDSALVAATSLRVTGEVCSAAQAVAQPPHHITDGRRVSAGVVGDSMSGREDTREDGRSGRKRPPHSRLAGCLSEVRATIVAEKRGNSRGAKGGRKVNVHRK